MTASTPLQPRDLDLSMAAGLFLACIVSFSIATALGFPHAYWAPMSVWVVAQPHRDHVILRGFSRLLGTLVGAAAGVAILAVHWGGLATLLLTCAWIAVAGGCQSLWGGSRRYIAFMAAITAAVVVLPNLLVPDPSIQVALERFYCVLIGVVTTVIVVGAITPPSEEWLQRRSKSASPKPLAYRANIRAEWSKFLLSGLCVSLGTLMFGLAGLMLDSPPAALMALGFAIFALILCGLPNPRKAARFLLAGTVIGATAAFLFRWAVLPHMATQEMALLSVFPILAIGAMARSYRPFSAAALDANMALLLIGQGSLVASTNFEAAMVDAVSISAAAVCAACFVWVTFSRPTLRQDVH